jgi:hypothetical protein
VITGEMRLWAKGKGYDDDGIATATEEFVT